MPRPLSLDVFFNDELAGTVHDTSPLSFDYSKGWLGRAQPMSLAAIALSEDTQSATTVEAFFENLLPEGELRSYIAEQKKASTLFSLLLETAGDTAGSFVLLPSGMRPEPPAYRQTSWAELGTLLTQRSIAALDLHSKGARISLAGAQDKASVAIFGNGEPMLPQGTSPSTHVLKPDIKRLAKVWESAANEAIVMAAAARCGLPTAEVFYEPRTRSCVVRRFDRFEREDGHLGRLIQYDLCQLSSTASEKKYEKEGGPGLAQCAALIRKFSSQPALDLRNFLGWIFFNLYTGNNDSHAKNLSIYYTPQAGVRLTPFYDLMCTRLYPGLSQEFAFSIGGEVMPDQVGRAHVIAMARQLGMQPQFVLRTARSIAQRLPQALASAVGDLSPSFTPGAKVLGERLAHKILSTTKQTSARIFTPA